MAIPVVGKAAEQEQGEDAGWNALSEKALPTLEKAACSLQVLADSFILLDLSMQGGSGLSPFFLYICWP